MKLWITVSEAWPPLDSGPWILSRNLISRRCDFSFLKPQGSCKPHSETSKDTGSNLVNNNQPGVVYHVTQKSAQFPHSQWLFLEWSNLLSTRQWERSEVNSLWVREQHKQDCLKQDKPQRDKVASSEGLDCKLHGVFPGKWGRLFRVAVTECSSMTLANGWN